MSRKIPLEMTGGSNKLNRAYGAMAWVFRLFVIISSDFINARDSLLGSRFREATTPGCPWREFRMARAGIGNTGLDVLGTGNNRALYHISWLDKRDLLSALHIGCNLLLPSMTTKFPRIQVWRQQISKSYISVCLFIPYARKRGAV